MPGRKGVFPKKKEATYHPLKTSLRGISFILNENSVVMTFARHAKAAKKHFLLLQTTKGANPPSAAAALYRQLHSRQRGFMLREQPISSASSALAGCWNVYTTRVQGRRAASPQGSLRGNAGVALVLSARLRPALSRFPQRQWWRRQAGRPASRQSNLVPHLHGGGIFCQSQCCGE